MTDPQATLKELIADSWFPFAGDLTIKALEQPVVPEPPRHGEGGVDCGECTKPDSDFIWTDSHWRLGGYRESPVRGVVLLKTRAHVDSFGDMPTELLEALGPMIQRVERVLMDLGGIARVHVIRWGDGGEHFHLWFMPRPLGALQLRGSMFPVWLDVLPQLPDEELQAAFDQIGVGMRATE